MLSIIIPIYNTGKEVEKLVDAIGKQAKEDVEIILVDDGSRDDSLAVIKKLAKKDQRVRVLHQENGGASAARNAGINISQGEYICFLDSDDLISKNYISKMLKAMEDEQTILAVCGMEYKRLAQKTCDKVFINPLRQRKNREKMVDYVLYLLCRDGRMYSSVNKIFRGDIIREKGVRFKEGWDFAEDTKFVLDYIAASNYSSGDIKFILKPLYIYNYGTETSTVKSSATKWENWQRSFKDTCRFATKMSGGKLGIKTRILLGLLQVRWQISYRRSKKRAAVHN